MVIPGHRKHGRSPVAAAVAAFTLVAAWPASASSDDIVMFDGFDGCAPVQALIGPEGGTLRLCGAQLAVPENAVATPTLFGIEQLATPPSVPFDMELAGPAFRFTPGNQFFDELVSMRVPREDARRGGLAMEDPVEESLFMIEACQYSNGGLQQFVPVLGTFATIRYVGDLPDNNQGLGDGYVLTTINGVTNEHDLDAPGSNWAIYEDRPDGSRQVTVSSMNYLNDTLEYVRMDFTVDAATSSGELQQISVIGAASGSYIIDLIGSATITFGDLADGRIRGQVEATLISGTEEVDFEASFDLGVERYYFPPELACPGDGKPPPG